MRLRNIPGAKEEVFKSPYSITEPQTHKGSWREVFGNNNPIYIEIGMGKGRFIIENAIKHPENNYIGIEKYPSVQIRAVQKLEKMEEIPNLKLLSLNAEILPEVFEKGEVKGIYLNFSDPWPKDRHSKRRLTSKEFLARYEEVLPDKGILEFKTDNKGLFEFSLQEIDEKGWALDAQTDNLHKDEAMNEGNIMTEYESKFSKLDKPIYKLICHVETVKETD
ncbi:MAG: tRNA (guanosine(46)-N7)-methyltransferase TrmB [Lachnospiraceae bacterium]|nr:tRNA (guanosine(46)-N7)-methyltransferase TrmB [Lachnospiraceae bacterium]